MFEKVFNAQLLEGVLNRALDLDSAARVRLEALEGVSFSLCLQGFPKTFVFVCQEGRILALAEEERADVRLSGSLSAFLRLLKIGTPFFEAEDKVHIEGDLESAQALQAFLSGLKPDFDYFFRLRFGESLGGVLSAVLDKALQGKRFALAQADAFLGSFLEGGFLDKESFADFSSRVDDVLRRVDMLLAKTGG